MPRTSAHSPNEIYETLKELKFVNEDGKLLPYSDDIWQKASDLFNGTMKKCYIYLYLSKNRNRVMDRLHGDRFCPSKSDNSLNGSYDNSCTDVNWSMENAQCGLVPLREKLTVKKNYWKHMAPHFVNYKERNYEVLEPGWTNTIYDLVWRQIKLPCPFSFKSAKVNRNPGEIFLKINGKCSECGAAINIYCENEPVEDENVFHVSTFDTRNIVHEKKRQLRGMKRNRIAKELIGKSTYAWRRDEANKLMEFGDVELASLYSEDVLRKAKQQTRDKELGVTNVTDPVSSILKLKYGTEFVGSIREIGLDRFFVMYWSPEQLFLYSKFRRESPSSTISIDATGRVVQAITKPDGSKRVTFLYQAVCGYRDKILPLFQMISEKHDTNILSYWMREWLRCKVSCPAVVVTDYSMALLNAVTLAFNDINLKTYVEICISILESRPNIQCPRTILRIDIAHLIKLVCRWECFKPKNPFKKDFFVRCIGMLTKCTTINNFVRICTDTLTVAFCPQENIHDQENPCYAAAYRLLTGIKSVSEVSELLSKFDEATDDGANDDEADSEDESETGIGRIIKRLEDDSQRGVHEGNRINPYYCPGFGKRLLKLSKHFVLWSAVMANRGYSSETQSTASSALSEEYFREIKTLLLKNARILRADKFLTIHLRSLAETAKLLNAPKKATNGCSPANGSQKINKNDKTDNTKIVECYNSPDNLSNTLNLPRSLSPDGKNNSFDLLPNDEPSSSENETTHLNEVETWRGQSDEPSKNLKRVMQKPRAKYLASCPDIESIHKRPKFSRNMPLLMNGSLLPPVKVDKSYVQVRNTCAFDSIAQSLLSAYCDRPLYHEHVSNSNHRFIKFIEQLSVAGTTKKIYEERAEILKESAPINKGILDCNINVSWLIEKFLLPNVASVQITEKCADCEFQYINIHPVLTVNTVPMYKKGAPGLQEAIEEFHTKPHRTKQCRRCEGSNVSSIKRGGDQMIIDLETLEIKQLATRLGFEGCHRQFTVSELLTELIFCQYKYKLVSAIVFDSSHYYAFIRRINDRWEIHNDIASLRRMVPVTKRELLQKHRVHLLVYIKTAEQGSYVNE